MTPLEHELQLDDCLDWIVEQDFCRIVVQLKEEDLKRSPEISNYLKTKHKERYSENYGREAPQDLDIYITKANTCCVDLLVTQHVSNVDAIIHIGQVCLTIPYIKNQQVVQPILFVFGHKVKNEQVIDDVESILKEIESLIESEPSCRICLLYDTSLIDHAARLQVKVQESRLNNHVDVASLHKANGNWSTTKNNQSIFITAPHLKNFGHFLLKEPIDHYTCAIYLGSRLSIHHILNGPGKLLKINCHINTEVERINTSKVLNRRMALVGRLKDQDELRVGVLITNPLPNLDEVIKKLRTYSEPRKHMLYFISMIQTIDECKIGNFDLCDAFVVVNSCTCSTILESLVFNRPILSELEFKLACGFEAEYGRVLWPGSSSHLSPEDLINKRKVSDVSLALIHTRNELLERCSQARINKWSGLEYKASDGDIHGGGLAIEEGLTGIASAYLSEPLEKTNLDEKLGHGSDCGGSSSSRGAGGGESGC